MKVGTKLLKGGDYFKISLEKGTFPDFVCKLHVNGVHVEQSEPPVTTPKDYNFENSFLKWVHSLTPN
jgi:hypothetical protein